MPRTDKVYCPDAGEQALDGEIFFSGARPRLCARWISGACDMCSAIKIERGRPMTEACPADDVTEGGGS